MAKPKGHVDRYWKMSEIRILRESYGTIPISQLAVLLKRSRGSVYRMAYRQGLHFTGKLPEHTLRVINSPGFIASRLAKTNEVCGPLDRLRFRAFLEDPDLIELNRSQLSLARAIAKRERPSQEEVSHVEA